ncbi:hypothetical protein VC83_00181 [Pseudogymnoascus destructans]|uniref:Uncharacterized protein n=2 Tax=Pseudogymnoascus destructans TaxID=655981 RepID=L8FVW8_PSED2|nr:uncharacterized protein VC83_00181 [Pseudogymnoascus destructans]ELR05095.1 hypothetical protein GMDG_07137 [Pseudogymnoascus destructans 20631-21]OAF63194.1 hypothetical protein VC83_00181 [Pseudogymnoascus destructans]
MAASEGPNLQDWNISKSAFLPPANRGSIRAWDRAKVPSRAPRLHGKKVWKKVARAFEKDPNNEEAQLELQKEGMGSRKKMRAISAKQNIRDAEWDGTEWEGFPDEISTAAEGAVHAGDDESFMQDDLKFVPRKRRNNNKVVSPKKSLRQTTLNIQAQPDAMQISHEGAIKRATRPRKSVRKSLRRSMLVDTESVTIPPQTESPKIVPDFNLANEASMLEVFSPVIRSPLKPPGKKQRVRAAKEQRSSAGGDLRLSGAFFAGTDNEGSAPSGPSTENAGIAGTPVRAAKATAVPATAPPKVHLSRNELEKQMVNFFTPIAKMKKVKRRSSPIKSYLQELLAKKSLPLEPLEKETEERLALADERISIGAVDIEQDQKQDDEASTEPASSDTDAPSTDDVQETPSPTDTTSEEQETTDAEANDASENPEPAEADHTPPTQPEQPVFEHTEDATHSDSPSESSESADSHESAESAESASFTPPGVDYDHDDTDMLRSFLTRVQASKASKSSPKRKRSPHSPLRIPLGDMDSNLSPSPVKTASIEPVDPTSSSPVKRSKRLNSSGIADEPTEPQSCRRSGRTRLPVKSAAPGAPSFIPMRRLGGEDTTLTLGGKNEVKELAALTRVNTRKNKAGALGAMELLAKKAEEKDDPVLRQRLLKEMFDEKEKKGKGGKAKKGVVWAEELTCVREFDEKKIISKGIAGPKGANKKKTVVVEEDKEEKATKVRVGMASSRETKIALGMGVNGTPAPKRRIREPRVKV